jgi:excisionase family DNA binding protein
MPSCTCIRLGPFVICAMPARRYEMTDAPVTWLTISEASQHAKKSRTSIYILIADGEIRPRKLGRRTLISRQELDDLIEAGAAQTATPGRLP